LHLTREYSLDPLEMIFIRELMQTGSVPHPLPAHEHGYALAGEPVRAVTRRMIELKLEWLPILERPGGEPIGFVRLQDLAHARKRSLQEERLRERVLQIRLAPAWPARERSLP
jgi:hypothetical protein